MNNSLKQRIMWRVYALYVGRTLLSRTALKAYILAIAFWRSTAYVSYTHVLSNAPSFSSVGRDIEFYGSALMKTEIMTIMLLAGMAIVGAWFVYDFVPHQRRA